MKAKWKATLIFGVAIIILLMPFSRLIPSMAIMKLNNAYHYKASLIRDENIEVKFPAGQVGRSQNWYPFMLIFEANEAFSRLLGREIDLTILYNFGGYDPGQGHSTFYDKTTSYYGAFMGLI